MTVSYKGYSKKFSWRLAEVSFTDEEWTLANRMVQPLRIKGWDFAVVTDGYAAANVDDFEQYKEFVEDYKAVKKCIRDCMKFGF